MNHSNGLMTLYVLQVEPVFIPLVESYEIVKDTLIFACAHRPHFCFNVCISGMYHEIVVVDGYCIIVGKI
jgi:hypothetical protein